MNIVDLEDLILQDIEAEFDYFKTVEKSRKIDFENLKLPAFCLQATDIEKNTIFNNPSGLAVNIKITAFLIYRHSDADSLLQNILDVISFLNSKKYGGLRFTFNNTASADFSENLPNSYTKAINFDYLTVI